MSSTPYDKAVAGFEALLEASSIGQHAKAAHLIADCAQHNTTGYRHTAVLEAEGFLRRDEAGVYLQGSAAQRIALSAFGLGRIAPVLPPILRRLREETQHTAFCAMSDGFDYFMGPHSAGRSTKHISLCASYRADQPEVFSDQKPSEVTLVPMGTLVSSPLHTLIIPVLGNDPFTALLGIILNPARMQDEQLAHVLSQAAAQVSI
jgi:hypothetical protein